MHGLMRGCWKRGRVLDLPSLQRTAWTAPEQSTTAPVSYSTFGLGTACTKITALRRPIGTKALLAGTRWTSGQPEILAVVPITASRIDLALNGQRAKVSTHGEV